MFQRILLPILLKKSGLHGLGKGSDAEARRSFPRHPAQDDVAANFQATFAYSTVMALATIVIGVVLVVPTSYWIQLRLQKLRPLVEFITLMPLVIPAIVIVFGYLRLYNSSSILPMTSCVT